MVVVVVVVVMVVVVVVVVVVDGVVVVGIDVQLIRRQSIGSSWIWKSQSKNLHKSSHFVNCLQFWKIKNMEILLLIYIYCASRDYLRLFPFRPFTHTVYNAKYYYG